MRLVAIILLSAAPALCQSSPKYFQLPDRLIWPPQKPLPLSLLNQPGTVVVAAPAKTNVCAIPLLNALPAAPPNTEFKMQVLRVPNADPATVVQAMPVCKQATR